MGAAGRGRALGTLPSKMTPLPSEGSKQRGHSGLGSQEGLHQGIRQRHKAVSQEWGWFPAKQISKENKTNQGVIAERAEQNVPWGSGDCLHTVSGTAVLAPEAMGAVLPGAAREPSSSSRASPRPRAVIPGPPRQPKDF